MNIISMNDFITLSKTEKIEIIDIRTIAEYKKDHIENARYVNEKNLLTTPERYLTKNTTYFIYCQKGNRSKKVVTFLNQFGYKTVTIEGGYQEYIIKK